MRLKTLRYSLSATDPGRSRLIQAAAVATGMLLSALWANAVVTTLHAAPALLTVGISMAMQMGLTPHDATARGRLVTTAAMLVPAALGAVSVTLLSQWREVAIALLVMVAGGATWVRQFGPRATALGFAAFFGCFFPLLLNVTVADLGPYLLTVVGVVASLSLLRALLLLQRPGHQIDLLLRELRTASAAALTAAEHLDARHPKALRMRLARMDNVAEAISRWQQGTETSRFVDADEGTFGALVLEARIAVEQACAELAKPRSAGSPAEDATARALLRALYTVLDRSSDAAVVAAAAEQAKTALRHLDSAADDRVLVARLARSVLAHQRLRRVSVHDSAPHPRQLAEIDVATAQTPAASSAGRADWWDWRQWSLFTRLAVQVMIATLLATVVGELISASRWYWAVLTAFVVFVGASSRGAILTRAYNRVLGTAAGLVVGVALVTLVHDREPLLAALSIASAFGMMYFGPLLYLYNAFFTTTLLVSLYGLLGDLDTQVMELRIGETVAGALTGVLCAYLIFSSNSRPTLLAKVHAYFQALDGLFTAGRTALTTRTSGQDVLSASARLQSALLDVDSAVTAMSAAMIGAGRLQRRPVVHLLYVGARAAEGFGASAIAVTKAEDAVLAPDAAAALDDVLARLRTAAGEAERSFAPDSASGVDDDSGGGDLDTFVVDRLDRLSLDPLSPQSDAFDSLAAVGWALQHVARTNRRS